MVQTATATDPYLDLLARKLTRAVFEDNDWTLSVDSSGETRRLARLGRPWSPILRRMRVELVVKRPYLTEKRESGRDWPARAGTMAGLARLANDRFCIASVLADDAPGDLIEAELWRGATSIYTRGVLKAHGVTNLKVWLAESFVGLPHLRSNSSSCRQCLGLRKQ